MTPHDHLPTIIADLAAFRDGFDPARQRVATILKEAAGAASA
ncbi:hypothetical protein [Methylobrevis pamukkalensis]|uniref:Uncharacterized protein n=1 Tax=Methylobrevis pamukkalensis TaxID=1439726 RepID=A0A1E3H8V2_9HYPH|nr:hypothetical protein [Methylobrevis pamukkalensis]ODN71921.1 hypothetical protein A6302_00753 [Methylobrevis pamukkalensis]